MQNALGLFENPYIKEDPVVNLLPVGRDIKRVAVIGPHANSTMVGFPHYTYPAVLPMLAAALKLGMFPMSGVGEVPKEGMAALQAEDTGADAGDLEQYVRKEYGAVSLAEAVRQLLPGAQVTAVAGTGVVPAQPTDIPAALAAAKAADLVILSVGGAAGWFGDNLTEKEGGDTANIDLPPQQVQLVNAITALGSRRSRHGTGPIDVSVGSSSSDIRSRATVNVIRQTRVIRGENRAFLSTTTVGS